MENVFVIAILTTFMFFVFKIVEMKYLEKEWKPLKFVVRDSLVVFIGSCIASMIFFHLDIYIHDFFNVVTDTKTLNSNATQIFTDAPGF